jgi:proteasome alpha subunit
MSLHDAVRLAVDALSSVGGEGGQPRQLEARQLEVAILDRARAGRAFRRITGAALTPLLAAADDPAASTTDGGADEAEGAGGAEPTIGGPGATPADKSPGGVDPTPGTEKA